MVLSEDKKFYLSVWIAPALIAIIIAGATVGLAVPMTALLFIIGTTFVGLIGLLWWFTPPSFHPIAKVICTLLLTVAMVAGCWWAVVYDRPILIPEMGGVITQKYDQDSFGLDVEALIKNSGSQAAYADRWKLTVIIDGTAITGKQIFGQMLPDGATIEPPLSEQEFPIGKPVRGWLFFAFPGVSRDFATEYFVCGSPLMDKVRLSLSVWDSKTLRERVQTRSLADLSRESCKNLAPKATPIPPSSQQGSTAAPTGHRQLTQTERAAIKIRVEQIRTDYEASHPNASPQEVVADVNAKLAEEHIGATIFLKKENSIPCTNKGIEFNNQTDSTIHNVAAYGCFGTGISFVGGGHNDIDGITVAPTPPETKPQ